MLIPARRAHGVGLALLSAIASASSGTLARPLIDAGWSAAAVVATRTAIAAILLATPAAVLLRGKWHVVYRNIGAVGAFGLLSVAAVQACFFNAIRYLPVGIALLLEFTGIILVVGWMWIVHGERPGRPTAVGSTATAVGLVLVLNPAGSANLDPVGVAWALCAAVGTAAYFVMSARSDVELPPVALASGGMGTGALVLGLLGLLGASPLRATPDPVELLGLRTSWLAPMAGLVLVAAAGSYVPAIAAARILGARMSSFLALTEVVFSVLIAWLVLGESPSTVQFLGGILIIAGIVAVRLDALRPPAPSLARRPPQTTHQAPPTRGRRR